MIWKGKVRIDLKMAKYKSMLYEMKKITKQKVLCICKSVNVNNHTPKIIKKWF